MLEKENEGIIAVAFQKRTEVAQHFVEISAPVELADDCSCNLI